jgi:hypothetical protein
MFPINPEKPKSNGVKDCFLGFVSPAEQAFLEALVWEHRFTMWIEFTGKDQIRATAFSKDADKLKWVDWMFQALKARVKKLNAVFFSPTQRHPLESADSQKSPPILLGPPGISPLSPLYRQMMGEDYPL